MDQILLVGTSLKKNREIYILQKIEKKNCEIIKIRKIEKTLSYYVLKYYKYYLDSQWKRITWYTQHKTENQSIAKKTPVQNLKSKDFLLLL